MKNLILTVCIITTANVFAQKQNLIKNSGFEYGSKNWSKYKKGYQISKENPYRGGKCLLLTRNARSSKWDDANGATCDVVFKKPQYGSFLFSTYYKMDCDAGGPSWVNFEITYADGTSANYDKIALYASPDWKNVKYIISPGNLPITRIQVQLTFRGSGKIAFDEISLCPLSKGVNFNFKHLNIVQPVFGDSGIVVNGAVNNYAKWKIILSADGKTIKKYETEGMFCQWLYDIRLSKNFMLEVYAQDKFGKSSLKSFFQISPSTLPNKKYCVWEVDSMEKVMPKSLPGKIKSNISCNIELAKNETEGIQLALRRQPGADIGNVKVEISDLYDTKTKEKIPSSAIKCFQVAYVKVGKTKAHPKAPEQAHPGWFPEALLPIHSLRVNDNNTMSIWLNVTTSAKTVPGLYHGTVTLSPENGKTTQIPFKVKVWNFTLPAKSSLKTLFGINYSDIFAKYGPKIGRKMQQKYAEYVMSFRIQPSPLNQQEMVNPYIFKNIVDKINVIAVGLPLRRKKFKKEQAFQIISQMSDNIAKTKECNLYKDAVYYAFDEFRESDKNNVRISFAEVKRHYPRLPTMATSIAVPIDVKALQDLNIDWLCPMFDYYNKAKAKAVREADPFKQIWSYISIGPGYPYINFLLEYPLIECRLWGWQSYQQEFDGFLYWGLNQYGQGDCKTQAENLISPADGIYLKWSQTTHAMGKKFDWLNGDGRVLFYGQEGPIGSIRMENFRDSLEDYEYLVLAKQFLGAEAAMDFAEKITTSLVKFSRSSSRLRQVRRDLAKKLENISSH